MGTPAPRATPAWASCTSLTATWCMGGPDSPPLVLLSLGLPLATSMASAGMVLAIVSASAPGLCRGPPTRPRASIAARASSTIAPPPTAGGSLTSSGLVGSAARTADTRSASALGSAPKSAPPWTLGQETFSSTPASGSSSSRAAATAAYASMVLPATEASSATPRAPRRWAGTTCEAKRSTPMFASPMALSMPPRTGTIRQVGCPSRGWSVMDLLVTAPRHRGSRTSRISSA